ncbi:hypothetical protein PND20_06685 [Ligilactobacillus ruminis]|uniref:hypothetical protein n=1 Tax=Ligilactobacillus ruminis TaxID=1623 RepID=UPI00232AB541|nr:hypothetical protein [Ligilactobacillus ruminis]MDB7642426.1 hypothetical protein [Ligilactobacillus ruminis]MDB7647014.1 hypothetical protein [Ligilactobacillus ruminis]MDB7649024.1 hypothetical protein [Ligilactobacillus ruminis]
MSLQDAFNSINKSGWNAKKDSVSNTYEGLAPGEYDTLMHNVTHAAYPSGYECLNFAFQVISGQHAGEYEFVRVNLADTKKDGSPMPDFVLSKNIKLLMKIAALCNVEIDNLDGNETAVYEHVVSLFAGHAESPMTMKITETPNKKDPDNPYRNYEFKEYEQPIETPQAADPFAEQSTTTDFDESDLPF